MTAKDKKSNRIILEMHGGGYVLGMSDTHRMIQ